MEFSEPPHTLSVENLQSRKYLVLDRDDNASILRHVYSRNLQLTKEFENFTRETAKRVISKYIDPYCGMLTECARMSSDSITGPSSPLWLSTAHADDVQKDMNLAEAPVRYRRGKKVSFSLHFCGDLETQTHVVNLIAVEAAVGSSETSQPGCW